MPDKALQSEMQQALETVGMYRTYGIHFDFEKATTLIPSHAFHIAPVGRILRILHVNT